MKDSRHIEDGSDLVGAALAANQDKLFALINMMMVRHSQDVMDVLQATNQAVIVHADSFDRSKPVWPWIKTIAINQVRDYFREEQNSLLNFDSELVDRVSDRVADGRISAKLDRGDYFDALHACLGKLPPLKRDLLRERYAEGQSVKDMAQNHSLSALSLATLIFRLRKALRNCIEKFVVSHLSQGNDADASGEDDDYFSRTLDFFLDGTLAPEKEEEFVSWLLQHPEKLDEYIEYAYLNGFLTCHQRQLFTEGSVSRKPSFRVRAVLVAAAVLALVLVPVFLLRGTWENRVPVPRQVKNAALSFPQKTAEEAAESPALKMSPDGMRISPTVQGNVVSKPVEPAKEQNLPPAAFLSARGKEEKEKNKMVDRRIITAVAGAATAVAVATQAPSVRRVQSTYAAAAESSAVPLDTSTHAVAEKADAMPLDTRFRAIGESTRGIKLNTNKFRGLVVMLI